MGVFSDVTDEFKKAPGKERALIIIGVVVTLGVAYYLYTKQSATGTQAAIGQKSGTEANQPTGYPITTGGTPTIPYNTNPLYSPSGDLVAFQTGGPNPTVPPIDPFGPPGRDPHAPLIPFGTRLPKNFWITGTKFNWGGTPYTIQAGGQGHVYGIDSSGNKILLYAPKSFYPGNANYIPSQTTVANVAGNTTH